MKVQNPVSISVIVPVYNEEKTVSKVVSRLVSNPNFCEVICVNDGSSDRSIRELQKFKKRIQLIDLVENRGKGQALAVGIQKATGVLVVFIDADLTNLSDDHIQALLSPILTEEADAVLGYAKRGEMLNLAAHLTGQRVYFRKELLLFLDQMAGSRFGVEVLLNEILSQLMRMKMSALWAILSPTD